jgi:hypothetical protein
VRLLFDLLSSCSGLLKHAAATTSAAVTIPAVDVQRAAADLDSCAVNGHRWQSPRRLLLPRRTTAPPSKTEVAAARGAVALAAGDAATAVSSTSGEPSIHASSSFGDAMRDSTASLARVADRRRRHL